jgi:hypothetical protein
MVPAELEGYTGTMASSDKATLPCTGKAVRATGVVVATALLMACTVAKPKLAEEVSTAANQGEDWNNSALWLYAASRAGSPKQECADVHGVLLEEESCKGALCRFSADLSKEWLGKCTKHVPDGAAAIEKVRAHSIEQASAQPSACAKEHEKLTDNCSTPECRGEAQKWATRCAESEAGPIAVRMLERAVERGGAPRDFRLEARSCATLSELQQAGARCGDSASCAEAFEVVSSFRAACLDDGKKKPNISVGAWQMAIQLGAGQGTEPIAVTANPPQLPTGSLPVMHTDGGGAMLRVCGKVVASPQEYLKARQLCEEGSIDFVRVFDGEQGPEVRLAKVYVNKELPFTALYPALRVNGELAHGEEVALGELVYVLGELGTGDEGVVKLLDVARKNARWMQLSVPIAELFRSNDLKLAPLLERIAKVKVDGAKKVYDQASLRGLAQRARTRPFADVGKEGQFELAGGGAAFFLDASKLMPKAMERYRAALDGLERSVRHFREPGPMELTIATEFGTSQAKTCGEAQGRMRVAQFQLLECASSSDGCADDQHQGFLKQWLDAREEAEQARRMLNIAMGALGEEGKALEKVARDARCGQPWW